MSATAVLGICVVILDVGGVILLMRVANMATRLASLRRGFVISMAALAHDSDVRDARIAALEALNTSDGK